MLMLLIHSVTFSDTLLVGLDNMNSPAGPQETRGRAGLGFDQPQARAAIEEATRETV